MPASSTTYTALFRIRSFPRLATSVLIARTANQMWELALVLFVLERFHSPTLAGLTVFLAIAPGVIVSPVAGALLDRHGRVRLMILDYLVAVVALAAIVAVDLSGHLTPPTLLPIVAIGSLTYSLSNSGARSLLPLIVPRHLWDRANALDSIAYSITMGAGPAAAGVLTALSGARLALAATAGFYLVAALITLRVPEPSLRAEPRPILADAWAGIVYVVKRNPTLRGILLTVSLGNLGWGIVVIALPVLVLQRLHGSPALVGALWAALAVANIPSALLVGRFNTEGRERLVMVLCNLALGAAVAVMALANNAWIIAAAMVAAGLANGPFDVCMFSLRQRRTDPAWYGRAFAVSMGLNWAGQPVGSAISGPLIRVGLSFAFLMGGLVYGVAAALVGWVIPAEDAGTISAESARQSRRDRPVEESPSSAEQGAG